MKKFSLRDLFWLVLVVAMGVGWWMDHRHAARPSEVLDRRYGAIKQEHDLQISENTKLRKIIDTLDPGFFANPFWFEDEWVRERKANAAP